MLSELSLGSVRLRTCFGFDDDDDDYVAGADKQFDDREKGVGNVGRERASSRSNFMAFIGI